MRGPPEVESPYILDLDSLAGMPDGPIDWAPSFGADRPLRVEIGVGNSPFLIELAKAEPEFNYLGFEYSLKRVLKFLKKVHRAEVENIRMLQLNSDRVLPHYVALGSVDHVFVNHPDPWRKYRHRRKRFIREERLRSVCDLLRDGGGFSLRTDAPAYAEEALENLERIESFKNVGGRPGGYAEAPKYPFETPYESRFKEDGLPIFYFEYRKRIRAESS